MKKIDEDFSTIVLCAERYALGRQSYMPSLVQDFIYRNIKDIDNRALSVMIRDIESAEDMGYGLGDEIIDKPSWIRLEDFLKNELERRNG